MGKDEIMTLTELQKYLRITKPTAIKILKEKKISANKVGGQWRILKSEVYKYLRGENK